MPWPIPLLSGKLLPSALYEIPQCVPAVKYSWYWFPCYGLGQGEGGRKESHGFILGSPRWHGWSNSTFAKKRGSTNGSSTFKPDERKRVGISLAPRITRISLDAPHPSSGSPGRGDRSTAMGLCGRGVVQTKFLSQAPACATVENKVMSSLKAQC